MANISEYLAQILEATLGREVRGSIYNAIDIINKVGEKTLTVGSTAPSGSAYEGSLYINTTSNFLYKYTASQWNYIATLKGDDGEPGEPGTPGNRWFRGTAVSGKSVTPAAFETGIELARVNDFYVNTSEGAIYHCTQEGDEDTALWAYDFTLSGGGGGGGTDDYADIVNNRPQINGHELAPGNNTLAAIGAAAAVNTYTKDDVDTALALKLNASDKPTKTSDLTNDSNFVTDANYTHTDNNYTGTDKNYVTQIPDISSDITTLTSGLSTLNTTVAGLKTPKIYESTTLSTSDESYTFNNLNLPQGFDLTNAAIDLYDTIFGFAPTGITVTASSVTVQFQAQQTTHKLKLFIY